MKKRNIVIGGMGLLLMYVCSQILVIKPEAIRGFVEGVMFSVAAKSSLGAWYAQLTSAITLFFAAFVLSFFIFQKNRNKIFYLVVSFTILKWAAEVFYFARMLDGRVEVKVWPMVVFFIAAYITSANLLPRRTAAPEELENNEAPSESDQEKPSA